MPTSTLRPEHFRNLVFLAQADGYLGPDETEFLTERAVQLGVSVAEVQATLAHPEKLYFEAPATTPDRETQLTDAVYLTLLNGQVNEREYALCLKLAGLLGLDARYLDSIIELIIKLDKPS